jgi:hypothetical protein
VGLVDLGVGNGINCRLKADLMPGALPISNCKPDRFGGDSAFVRSFGAFHDSGFDPFAPHAIDGISVKDELGLPTRV